MKRFGIGLLVRHPDIDPESISRELNLEPYASAKFGAARVTPSGTALPGVHDRSWWNHFFHYEGAASCFDELEKLVDQLATHQVFLLKISTGGGHVELYFQFPGDTNQGGTATPSLLRKMADLQLHLGAEVFPGEGSFARGGRPGITRISRT